MSQRLASDTMRSAFSRPISAGDVAGHDGDGADIEFRRSERQHQGQRVIRAGIGIEDDFLGGGRGSASAASKAKGMAG